MADGFVYKNIVLYDMDLRLYTSDLASLDSGSCINKINISGARMTGPVDFRHT